MLSIFKIVNGVIKGCNSLKNKLLYTNEISNGLTMARYTYGGQNELRRSISQYPFNH